MPTKYLTVGPGVLTLGESDKLTDCSTLVRSISIVPNVEKTDAIMVLSGDSIPGGRTYSYQIEATVLQSVQKKHLIAYSWENGGAEIPFEFVPKSGSKQAKITGKVVVDPIKIGGEVGSKPTSDLQWECVGTPAIEWDDTPI